MAHKILPISADSLIVHSSSANMGAGAGAHLPVGLYSGYIFRALLKFSLDWSSVSKIAGATLFIRISDQNHLAFGSSPRVSVYRNTTSWSEGTYSCESGYSTGNASVYPGPSVASSFISTGILSTAQNAWVAIDITGYLNAWAPASVQASDGSPGAAVANYGIQIRSYDEASSSRTTEFWSRNTTSDAYIDLSYETNQPPGTPTLGNPSGTLPSGTSPVFNFSAVDPDPGDTLASYDIHVSSDPTFAAVTHWNVNRSTNIVGWSVTGLAYGGTALTPGTTYYWRVRVHDAAGGSSPFSASKSFTIAATPSFAPADLPYANANHVAPIHNLADLTTVLVPKAEFSIVVRDPAGGAIQSVEAEITGFASTVVAGPWPSGTTVVIKHPAALVNGTGYQVRFRQTNSTETGPWSVYTLFKVWYSQAIYEWNTGGSSGWSASASGVTAPRYQLLYRTATGAAGAGATAWRASLPATAAWLNFMLRTCSSGTAPALPTVAKITINYTQTATLPNSWTFVSPGSVGWTLEQSIRRYGVRSIRMDLPTLVGAGNAYAWQDVDVSPDQTYAFSAWVRGEGVDANSVVSLFLYPGGTSAGAPLKRSPVVAGTAVGPDWQRIVGKITPAELGGLTTVRFMVHVTRTGAATPGTIWFDAAMLSEGEVAPVWTPALVGAPVVIDANGIIMDGGAGAILNLIGSAGGVRDIVELGAHGLMFGGDTEVWSPLAGRLIVGGPTSADTQLTAFGNPGRRAALAAYVSGDAQFRSALWGDATLQGLEFGPGNAVRDVNLYRAGLDLLATDDALRIAGALAVSRADIQAGAVNVTLSAVAAVSQAITFPVAFSAGVAPIVVVTIDNAGAIDLVGKVAASPLPSITGFTAIVSSVTNTARSGTIRLAWIAFRP